jgi:3-hydroxybutyryl-CoA dehydrogenase
VARPFYGEALRLLGDGVAKHELIDLIVRLGGGFRMGPFQLMDLIGIDVNLSAMQSMYEQTFGEPRYRPHPIQVRMVQQNTLGRKTGRGFYVYEGDPSPEPVPPQRGDCQGLVLYEAGTWAPGMHEVVRLAGYTIQDFDRILPENPQIAIVASGRLGGLRQQLAVLEGWLPVDVPILCQCVDVTLTEISSWMRTPQRLVGFDGLTFAGGRAATLVASPTLTLQSRAAVEDFITSLGYLSVWIDDSPGLILPRIICMLANEAAFALQEGVAGAEQIDQAMQLGASFPRGPFTWAKQIGYAHVLRVLEHLQREFGEDRYRPAYLLRRWARIAQQAD